jgi:uncharacterized protein (TIGR03086 family)
LTQPPLNAEKTRQCFLAAIESTSSIVAAVQDDAWTRPTPCDEWDVKDIVNHLVYENVWAVELFNGRTIDEVGDKFEGDLVGDSPKSTYLETANAIREVVERSDSMSVMCNISSGPVPGSEYASQLFVDTLIHGWDIAAGSGQPGVLDPELVAACMPLARAAREAVGESGPFGTTVAAKESASAQSVLLGLLGRDSDAWIR